MKTLLLLRHGKSDWDADFDHDHDRPLAKRGRKAANKMGRFLADVGQVPDRILCSTAVRAVQTLEHARRGGAWEAPVRTSEVLYEAGADGLLAEIQREADTTTTLMLVGHEPTWSDLLSRLIGGGEIRFPTAAAARVDLDVLQWREAAHGKGQLIWLIPPRLVG